MKGDFTRNTFKNQNHYRDVRMQQGRVQLDADWNEQMDIVAHHRQTVTADQIGLCGGPMHSAGFDLVPKGTKVEIGHGHYYVNGILCENETTVPAGAQPDLPDGAPLISENGEFVKVPNGSGKFLFFLDVWTRHLSAAEASQLVEPALLGPDTATRTKTVWQVKAVRVGDIGTSVHCLSDLPIWDELTNSSEITLAAKAEEGETSSDPCILAPGAGYRRLENQLYRVEIHSADGSGKATYKWSRDNGSVVANWVGQDGKKLTLSSVGRDKVLNFAADHWVELIDDDRELLGLPGVLVRIEQVESNEIIIDTNSAIPPGDIEIAAFGANPRARRWDSKGELTTVTTVWKELEDGVFVKFGNNKGRFRTGDYWLIPARTATGNVDWPVEENAAGDEKPVFQRPHGIEHNYCRLALIDFDDDWKMPTDCRRIFPPVTELTSFFYLGGDGQEAMPGQILNKPLRVGVSNGRWPVAKARVQFEISPPESGGGVARPSLIPGGPDHFLKKIIVTTDDLGVAECYWKLDAESSNVSQQVEATLLDADGISTVHLPITFTSNLSLASLVHYEPPDCTDFGEESPTVLSLLTSAGDLPDIDKDGQETVKDVLDAFLCRLDASKIPIKVRECSNSILSVGKHTIADALLSLCHLERQIGCSVSISSDQSPYGKYKTIEEALIREEGDDICLCLLPGDHVLKPFTLEKMKRTIGIKGCNTRIITVGSDLKLFARKLILDGLNFELHEKDTSIILSGEEITIENCIFTGMNPGENSPPLVTISPVDSGQSSVTLRWKSNRMNISWIENPVPKGFSDYLMPVNDVEYPTAARERLKQLSNMNPHGTSSEFDSLLEKVATDIEGTKSAMRIEWFERRAQSRITKIPEAQRSAIEGLFNTINRRTMTRTNKVELRENLKGIAKSFLPIRYGNALALKSQICGWVEDSVFRGFVVLHYPEEKPVFLRWLTGKNENEIAQINEKKSTWIKYSMENREFISEADLDLEIRGNFLYGVRSHAAFIMEIIDNILKNGEGVLKKLDLGYSTLILSENIFASNLNSIIGRTVLVQGNQFAGGENDFDVVVNVLGSRGSFVGNSARNLNNKAIIECLLNRSPAEAANLLRVEG